MDEKAISNLAAGNAAPTHRLLRTLLSVLCLLLALISVTRPLDHRSLEFVEAGLQRSLAAFAVARGLNAVISVAQGTELALQPAGVGLNLAPGQALDPINDLIERFSWLMLASSATFGVQAVILHLGAWIPFVALSGLLLVGGALSVWPVQGVPHGVRHWLFKAAVLIAFLRFTLPLATFTSDLVYREFLAPTYVEATRGLEETSRQLEQINREVESSDVSFLERARKLLDKAAALIDLQTHMHRYKAAVEHSVRHTVDLIVVFIVQTFVVPVLVIAAAWVSAKDLLRRRYRFI